jgi:hypothetical protein
MPVTHLQQPPDEHPVLVAEVVRVLVAAQSGAAPIPGEPDITIEDVKHSNSLHVTVIWDKWAGIDPETRGKVILDAFAKARGEGEMLRITLALGLTRDEDFRLRARSALRGAQP